MVPLQMFSPVACCNASAGLGGRACRGAERTGQVRKTCLAMHMPHHGSACRGRHVPVAGTRAEGPRIGTPIPAWLRPGVGAGWAGNNSRSPIPAPLRWRGPEAGKPGRRETSPAEQAHTAPLRVGHPPASWPGLRGSSSHGAVDGSLWCLCHKFWHLCRAAFVNDVRHSHQSPAGPAAHSICLDPSFSKAE